MYNGNPFVKRTFVIHENDPELFQATNLIEAVSIRAGKSGETPNLTGINKTLMKIPNSLDIRLFEIDYNSKLTKLPDLDIFSNLEFLHLACRKIKDFSNISNLKKIKQVFLCNYSESNLKLMEQWQLKSFRAIRGCIEAFDVSSSNVFLQQCTKLKEFKPVQIERLVVERCNMLDLDSLKNVEGCKVLELISPKTLPDFDFLNGLPVLEKLVVTANNLKNTDMSGLVNSHVSHIFLAVSDALVKQLGRLNTNSLVTNGKVIVDGGVVL